MDELLAAITTRYRAAAGATLRAIVNGLYAEEPPAGTTAPYIQYTVFAGDQHDSMSTKHSWYHVRFSVFSETQDSLQAWQAAEAVKDLFQDEKLTLSTWTNYGVETVEPGRALQDPEDQSWVVHVELRYMIGQ